MIRANVGVAVFRDQAALTVLARVALRSSAIRIRFVGVLNVILASRGDASTCRAREARAVRSRFASLSHSARRAHTAATVDVRLAGVPHAVAAVVRSPSHSPCARAASASASASARSVDRERTAFAVREFIESDAGPDEATVTAAGCAEENCACADNQRVNDSPSCRSCRRFHHLPKLPRPLPTSPSRTANSRRRACRHLDGGDQLRG